VRLRGRFVLVMLLISSIGLLPAPALAQSAGFPEFRTNGGLFDHGTLAYNPTNEWIFPSIIRAADHFTDPFDIYYLYTAPHDGPGGVSLFHAPSLNGPWTEHVANPVIPNRWEPHYSVSHVSSPEAFWVEDEQQLFMYFHGENDRTRFATSTDGITFEYGDTAVTAAQSGTDIREASYARVAEYAIPGTSHRYIMLFMDRLGSVRRIRLATSADARSWVVRPTPLVSPRGAEGQNISSASYFPWQGRHYVTYHATSGNVHLTEVGADFALERHLGVLYDSLRSDPENGRSAAPTFVSAGGTLHMFYEAGRRGSTTIAHATADLDRLGPLAQPHYEFTDVANPSTHFHPIHRLASVQLTTGCGRITVYCPDRSVTRAEMASFLARALDLELHSTARFSDVTPGTTHAGAIEAIAAAGLTNGCGNGRYCPDRPVSRAEMATFLMRAVELTPVTTSNQFVDVTFGATHTDAINAIARAGITTGCGRTTHYCPERDVTRAEMASFLVRGFAL
jgi:hypothetical protein